MKVAQVSNKDDESYIDRFITESIDYAMAKIIARALNKELSSMVSPDYYRVVADDYELNRREP
jgi:vacuolar-type H+-ATPase subunit C/Vma6